MKTYIAKAGTWFDVGTEADLVERLDYHSGLFYGLKNGKFEETVCEFKEFQVKWVPEQAMRNRGGDNGKEQD